MSIEIEEYHSVITDLFIEFMHSNEQITLIFKYQEIITRQKQLIINLENDYHSYAQLHDRVHEYQRPIQEKLTKIGHEIDLCNGTITECLKFLKSNPVSENQIRDYIKELSEFEHLFKKIYGSSDPDPITDDITPDERKILEFHYKYKCGQCNKTFKTEGWLIHHVRKVHPN